MRPVQKKPVICDLDGTLADSSHRVHLFEPPIKEWDWEAIREGIPRDRMRGEVLALVEYFHRIGHRIIYLTRRSEDQRKATVKWLKQTNLSYLSLIMSDPTDFSDDLTYKLPKIEKLDPEWIIEDRPHIVKALRDKGYKVIDVGIGIYDKKLDYEKNS